MIYSVIIWKSEFNTLVKVKEGVGTFSRIIITSGLKSLELINTYRIHDDSKKEGRPRYEYGYGAKPSIFFEWLETVVRSAASSVLLVGDFNIDKNRPTKSKSELDNITDLAARQTDFKSLLSGVTFIRGSSRSAIDYAYYRNFEILKWKILDLRADLGSDGHLGFEIKIDLDFSRSLF